MKKRRADTPAIEGGTPVRATILPFYRAAIDERDVESVVDTLRSGWLTIGITPFSMIAAKWRSIPGGNKN